MRVHAVSHAGALASMDLTGWTTVVIDCIRASSTIAQAVASGCREIVPVSTVEEAHKTKAALGDGPDVLLCGEREGLRVKGFDLGNSPREYTPEAVRGRRLVFTTTNGTAAMVACRTARKVVVGAFLNMEAVLKHLTDEGGDVLVVPVGREGVPVLDDTVCGGLYVERLARVGATDLNGPAYFARMAHQGYAGRLLDAMRDSPSGKNLLRIGLGDDLPYCVQVGLLDVVPLVANGRILGQE